MLHYQNNKLTVFQSALFQTTSAVIESEEALIVTDPTWLPHEIEEIKQHINKRIGSRQLYIIYTHSDFDHIIGAGSFPDAKVIATEAFQTNSKKQEILREIHNFDQEYYLMRNYEPKYPSVDRVIREDREKLVLSDMTLMFYKAPGHTADGLFTVVEPLGVFLSGDYFSDVEFPFITSSYKDYVTTVDKAGRIMDHKDIRIHVPGHGSVSDEREELLERIAFSADYLKRLAEKDTTLETALKEKFRFFEGMKSSHQVNREMAKKELET